MADLKSQKRESGLLELVRALLGIEGTPGYHQASANRLPEIGYAGLAAMISE